jgi:hypothetical protein
MTAPLPTPESPELLAGQSLGAARGSASGATFQTLFESAKKSPIYWLEGLNIEHGERLIKLKDQLKRTAHYNTEKQLHLKGQILAARKCLREVKRIMAECEKMPNAEVSHDQNGERP